MSGGFVVYGGKGTGSVPVEAALTLLGQAYEVVDVYDRPEKQGAYAEVNPQLQAPALVLPSVLPVGRTAPLASQSAPSGGGKGEVLTESLAILVWLADAYPQARLAPAPDSPLRARFLRWMSYISAQIYALYWIRDRPSRIADGAEAEALVKARTAERIADCWRMMGDEVDPLGAYMLGEDLSVLDLYMTVISRWGPRRRRFYAAAPNLEPVVRRVDAEPRLAALWAERMPFDDGWEG